MKNKYSPLVIAYFSDLFWPVLYIIVFEGRKDVKVDASTSMESLIEVGVILLQVFDSIPTPMRHDFKLVYPMHRN